MLLGRKRSDCVLVDRTISQGHAANDSQGQSEAFLEYETALADASHAHLATHFCSP